MRDPQLRPKLSPVESQMANESSKDIASHDVEPIQERIQRVQNDVADLERYYKVLSSPTRYDRMMQFYNNELKKLQEVPFDEYDQEGKVDFLLLKNYMRYESRRLEDEAANDQKVLAFLGGYFSVRLAFMIEARQRVENVDAKQAATLLNGLTKHIAMVKDRIIEKKETVAPTIAWRATETLNELAGHVDEWYGFYKDYDPLFTWWVADPYPELVAALRDLSNTIKTEVLGIAPDDEDTIIGEPIGREAVLEALDHEMIPYSPEALIEIGNKEYEWCEREMQKAAADIGFQNWRDALEHVKNLYVEPGQQPYLVRDMIYEASEYVKKHDLVTVPPLCEENWRAFMMTPERQKINPFFLGGDDIIVSYPTSTMSHPDKLMSLRGNNIHFARATVFHEMIPGHHLQMYVEKRVRPYRRVFRTPFYIEGWAFYWEMNLWDKDSWEKTPENRIGMLFWRMHRCARIIFSLKYHLGEMTAQECIELLVNWVGHERATAEGEVRRSVMGGYGPLYQAAYMLGGLQIYALRKEFVDKEGLREKEFHDALLRANQMPIEMFRALISGEQLERDYESHWEFYGGLDE